MTSIAAASRYLGDCTKCGKWLIERCSASGIWCYNHGEPESEQIVFLNISARTGLPRYNCRTCSSARQKAKHDRTF